MANDKEFSKNVWGIESDLIEKWFIAPCVEIKKGCQFIEKGQILKDLGDNFFLVEIEEIFTEPGSFQKIVNIKDMASWKFYPTSFVMDVAYSSYLKDQAEAFGKYFNLIDNNLVWPSSYTYADHNAKGRELKTKPNDMTAHDNPSPIGVLK